MVLTGKTKASRKKISGFCSVSKSEKQKDVRYGRILIENEKHGRSERDFHLEGERASLGYKGPRLRPARSSN
jgi:hypothetical protein